MSDKKIYDELIRVQDRNHEMRKLEDYLNSQMVSAVTSRKVSTDKDAADFKDVAGRLADVKLAIEINNSLIETLYGMLYGSVTLKTKAA